LHIPNHTRFAQIYPGNPRWWRIDALYHFQGFTDMLKRTLIVAACAALVSVARADAQPDLMNAYATLESKHFIDLTHSFGVTTPHWKGFGEMRRRTLYTIRKDGFHVEEFCHVGQWGTHVDPPAHFHEGLKTVDQIDLKDMLMPLVVLDVHEKVAKNPDYVLSLDDVRAWESRHGRIPEHAFVAMRTDWSKRWPNDASMQNKDEKGVAHYPGWSMAVLKLLYEDRHIAASGHETTDTDPGVATTKDDYSLESYVLGTNHYQIEMLANLDQVPEYGALVMVSFPKPESGSGFPARVIAISP
jgi:kynurenine formamidase